MSPRLRAYWPSVKWRVILVQNASDTERGDVISAERQIRRFVADVFGRRLARQFGVVVAKDGAAMNGLIQHTVFDCFEALGHLADQNGRVSRRV